MLNSFTRLSSCRMVSCVYAALLWDLACGSSWEDLHRLEHKASCRTACDRGVCCPQMPWQAVLDSRLPPFGRGGEYMGT